MEKKITSSDFFWTFVRSNFLQASWNMERMQVCAVFMKVKNSKRQSNVIWNSITRSRS